MRTRIVSFGKSEGVRIPKRLFRQVGLSGEVEIAVRDGALVIGTVRKPREGWEEAFREMARRGDDVLPDWNAE